MLGSAQLHRAPKTNSAVQLGSWRHSERGILIQCFSALWHQPYSFGHRGEKNTTPSEGETEVREQTPLDPDADREAGRSRKLIQSEEHRCHKDPNQPRSQHIIHILKKYSTPNACELLIVIGACSTVVQRVTIHLEKNYWASVQMICGQADCCRPLWTKGMHYCPELLKLILALFRAPFPPSWYKNKRLTALKTISSCYPSPVLDYDLVPLGQDRVKVKHPGKFKL